MTIQQQQSRHNNNYTKTTQEHSNNYTKLTQQQHKFTTTKTSTQLTTIISKITQLHNNTTKSQVTQQY